MRASVIVKSNLVMLSQLPTQIHTHAHTVLGHSKSVLVCKQVIIYTRVMAVIQHASVSFASNQYNGLSDKEGGVPSHSMK